MALAHLVESKALALSEAMDVLFVHAPVMAHSLGLRLTHYGSVNAARRYALACTVVKGVPSTGGAPHADRAQC